MIAGKSILHGFPESLNLGIQTVIIEYYDRKNTNRIITIDYTVIEAIGYFEAGMIIFIAFRMLTYGKSWPGDSFIILDLELPLSRLSWLRIRDCFAS